jgi:hypothetical protein
MDLIEIKFEKESGTLVNSGNVKDSFITECLENLNKKPEIITLKEEYYVAFEQEKDACLAFGSSKKRFFGTVAVGMVVFCGGITWKGILVPMLSTLFAAMGMLWQARKAYGCFLSHNKAKNTCSQKIKDLETHVIKYIKLEQENKKTEVLLLNVQIEEVIKRLSRINQYYKDKPYFEKKSPKKKKKEIKTSFNQEIDKRIYDVAIGHGLIKSIPYYQASLYIEKVKKDLLANHYTSLDQAKLNNYSIDYSSNQGFFLFKQYETFEQSLHQELQDIIGVDAHCDRLRETVKEGIRSVLKETNLGRGDLESYRLLLYNYNNKVRTYSFQLVHQNIIYRKPVPEDCWGFLRCNSK